MLISSYLSAIPLPAIFIGPDARIQGANELAISIKPNAGDRRAFILVFRQPGVSTAIEKCLQTRQVQRAIYLHSDGPHEIRYEVTCSYISDGGLTGVLACFQDITHLEQAGEIRREFVANVSHELKTPLTALIGFVETLRGPARNDEKARDRFLGIMEAEANRMNRLVGDLLSLSRVEENARMRPTELVNVPDILRSITRNLATVAEAQESTVELDFTAEDVRVPADADQLIQVFTNLIENALKYGGKGRTVHVTLDEIEKDLQLRKPAIKVSVIDNGPGIDPVHIPRLTERFYRIDSHRSREMGGTGLGLAIVKHIVNRHRGRMKIESELGLGSKFTVVLPKN